MRLDDSEPAALQGIAPGAIGSAICGLAPGQRLVLGGPDRRGEFYFATEGSDRPRRIETPLCLSFHSVNPPSPDNVIERARRSRTR